MAGNVVGGLDLDVAGGRRPLEQRAADRVEVVFRDEGRQRNLEQRPLLGVVEQPHEIAVVVEGGAVQGALEVPVLRDGIDLGAVPGELAQLAEVDGHRGRLRVRSPGDIDRLRQRRLDAAVPVEGPGIGAGTVEPASEVPSLAVPVGVACNSQLLLAIFSKSRLMVCWIELASYTGTVMFWVEKLGR